MQLSIGQILKKYRLENKLTQEELAALVGVKRETIYKYENDIIKIIPSDKFVLLAAALHLSVDDINYIGDILAETSFIQTIHNATRSQIEEHFILIRKADFTPAQLEQLQAFIAFLRSQGPQDTPKQ